MLLQCGTPILCPSRAVLTQGWTPDFVPAMVEYATQHKYYDELGHVSGDDAIHTSQELARKEEIFTGPRGGGVLAVALKKVLPVITTLPHPLSLAALTLPFTRTLTHSLDASSYLPPTTILPTRVRRAVFHPPPSHPQPLRRLSPRSRPLTHTTRRLSPPLPPPPPPPHPPRPPARPPASLSLSGQEPCTPSCCTLCMRMYRSPSTRSPRPSSATTSTRCCAPPTATTSSPTRPR